MNYHILELPLDTAAVAIQKAINNTQETLVSIVADTVNKRWIIITKP